MLSVADTAHSVYPELIVGLPGLAETGLRSRRFMPFPFLMGESVVDFMPEVANAGAIPPSGHAAWGRLSAVGCRAGSRAG